MRPPAFISDRPEGGLTMCYFVYIYTILLLLIYKTIALNIHHAIIRILQRTYLQKGLIPFVIAKGQVWNSTAEVWRSLGYL